MMPHEVSLMMPDGLRVAVHLEVTWLLICPEGLTHSD